MTEASPSRPTLPIGSEPSGAGWVVFRYPDDWGGATARHAGTVFDPTRGVVELAPLVGGAADPFEDCAPAAADPDGHPELAVVCAVCGDEAPPRAVVPPRAAGSGDGAVSDEEGTRYRSDPSRDVVLRWRACDDGWSPWPGFGGPGRATGRLRHPRGLAIGPRGFVYVADSGNHRVQVVRPDDASVVVVLGAVDPYGGPVAGEDHGAMTGPTAVAVDPRSGRIFVLDPPIGAVHVFDAGFTHCVTWRPRPALAPDDYAPDLAGIAVAEDGSVLVADRGWPRLLHRTPGGAPLPELAWSEAPALDAMGGGRFPTRGAVLVGPLDAGIYDARWHEVRVEAELPEGTRLVVRTFAANDAAGLDLARLAPGPEHAVPVPMSGESPRDGEYARLVLADWSDPSAAPTDRGCYLWVALCLEGDGAATPSVRALRAMVERPSLLRWLPAVYGQRDAVHDPPGAVFLERYLALLGGVLDHAELRYEQMAVRLDPDAAPPDWLEWLASWLDLVFDPSWSLAKRRQLVREAVQLYRRRGTPYALARTVEIYTGRAPAVVEGFRRAAVAPQVGRDVVGWMTLGGAEDDAGSGAGSPGSAAPAATEPDGHAHHFELYAYADDVEHDAAVARQVLRAIVEAEKPAHTTFELHVVFADARAGVQSTVGLDFMVGDDVPPCAVLHDQPDETHGVVLGDDWVLGDGRFRRLPRGLVLDDVGVAVDPRTFELT